MCSEAPSKHNPEFCVFKRKRHKISHFYSRYSHFWLCLWLEGTTSELPSQQGNPLPQEMPCWKSQLLLQGLPARFGSPEGQHSCTASQGNSGKAFKSACWSFPRAHPAAVSDTESVWVGSCLCLGLSLKKPTHTPRGWAIPLSLQKAIFSCKNALFPTSK